MYWFEREFHNGWATCPMTQPAFVHRDPVQSAVVAHGAFHRGTPALDLTLKLPSHHFGLDKVSLGDVLEAAGKRLMTGWFPRQPEHQEVSVFVNRFSTLSWRAGKWWGREIVGDFSNDVCVQRQ